MEEAQVFGFEQSNEIEGTTMQLGNQFGKIKTLTYLD
jgi:hypothetical protein